MKSLRAFVALIILAAPALAQDAYVIGPPGAYTVQTPGTTKVERGDGWIKISWVADPGPAPNPGPAPEPPPNPEPPPAPVATGKLYVSLIFDSTAETQDQATARADMATADWSPMNATFRAYDVKQKALDELNIRGSVGELPCLIVQELKDGAKSAPVVKTVASIGGKDAAVEAVQTLRGGK